MSNTRYLIDLKNQRSFELGDRYYSTLFCDVKQPLSLEVIEADITEHGNYGSPELARRLLAFCENADWKLELRYETAGYENGRYGDDGFTCIGSVWDLDLPKRLGEK